MENYSVDQFINVGVGVDVSIGELARMVQSAVGFEGEIVFDTSKPNGTARKLLDVSRLTDTGWTPRIGLEQGVEETYHWFLEHIKNLRQ